MNTETTTIESLDETTLPAANHFRLPSLSAFLRGIGAVTLIAAMSTFLFEGWQFGDDVYRYLLLLAFTAGLTIIGFGTGAFLQDGKGARLLLMLSLFAVPANFAILGGLLYSQTAIDPNVATLPTYVRWSAIDLAQALTTTGAASAVLVLIAVLGFMVLARNSAAPLAATFAAANAALLIPVRDSAVIGPMVLVLSLIVLAVGTHLARKNIALRTLEGIISRALLILPVVLLGGRSFFLHNPDAVMFTSLALSVFFAVRHLSLMDGVSRNARIFLERVNVIPAFATAIGVAGLLNTIFDYNLQLMVLGACFTFSVALTEISLRAVADGPRMRQFASSVVTIGTLGVLVLFGDTGTALFSLVSGIGLATYGYSQKHKSILLGGVVMIIAGLGYAISDIIAAFHVGTWGALAAIGIMAVIAGSTIDRYGSQIKLRAAGWKKQFGEWSY